MTLYYTILCCVVSYDMIRKNLARYAFDPSLGTIYLVPSHFKLKVRGNFLILFLSLVYTFDFYQHLLNMATFEVKHF